MLIQPCTFFFVHILILLFFRAVVSTSVPRKKTNGCDMQYKYRTSGKAISLYIADQMHTFCANKKFLSARWTTSLWMLVAHSTHVAYNLNRIFGMFAATSRVHRKHTSHLLDCRIIDIVLKFFGELWITIARMWRCYFDWTDFSVNGALTHQISIILHTRKITYIDHNLPAGPLTVTQPSFMNNTSRFMYIYLHSAHPSFILYTRNTFPLSSAILNKFTNTCHAFAISSEYGFNARAPASSYCPLV